MYLRHTRLMKLASKYQVVIGLILLVFVAFWPITTGMFVPKWDNIDCYLPYRYFVHFAFDQGELPLWNPFQHMGYPAYSDLQNGLYNPIIWVIHLIGNYTTLSLSIELSLYWIIGIVGAYKFMGLFVTSNSSKLFGAIAFGLSGFMVGTAQIMIFIAGAAYLTHVLFHAIRFFQSNAWKDVFWLSLFIGLHLSSASPAYSIVLFYILLAILIWAILKKYRSPNTLNWQWNRLGVAALLTICCILPIVTSVVEFIPYFGRAQKLEYSAFLLQNPFDWHEYISFIFPFSTLSTSDWFGTTDLTMRNGYIGFLPILFAGWSIAWIRERRIKFLWLFTVLFLVLAAGGETPLYKLIYHLPGFGLFRHPSIFRAHVLLLLCVLAAITFERFEYTKYEFLRTAQRSVTVLLVTFSLLLILLVIYRNPGEIRSWFEQFGYSNEPQFFSIRTLLSLNTLLILCVLIGVLAIIRINPTRIHRFLILISVADLLIHALISGPYTVAYPYRQADYISYFERLPSNINQKDAELAYEQLVENYDPKIQGVWRNTATLHKRLSFDGHNQTQFTAFNELEQSGKLKWALSNPLFCEINGWYDSSTTKTPYKGQLWEWEGIRCSINSDTMKVSSTVIALNQFSAQVVNTSTKDDILLLSQNYHQNWKAALNGKALTIYKANHAFMAVIIPKKAKGTVQFTFTSNGFVPSTIVAVLCYMLLVLLLVFTYMRKSTIE